MHKNSFIYKNKMRLDVAVIGGGSWGSTISKVIGENYASKGIEGKVTMWLYPETYNSVDLAELITTTRINSKYLPGIELPKNITVTSDICSAVDGADVLVVAVPHEFLNKILQQIKNKVKSDAVAVILTKGLFFNGGEMELISSTIKKTLNIRACTLMGANIAGDVANSLFSECTLGYENEEIKDTLLNLFDCKYFKVTPVKDSGAVEVCGTLKNVVAVACGIVSGHKEGANTLAAVIRNGLLEIVKFCDMFVQKSSTSEMIPRVFFESCGVADLIVTCTSGRNFKYSRMAAEKNIDISRIEEEEMNGQKLQGYSTIKDLKVFIEENKIEKEYPFLYAICLSASSDLSSKRILEVIQNRTE
ncbi:glycerol-3-phosphate dehydrogenase (NAD+) [Nematocida parisii]|nr:glycerol-3-phosphate dehydrogenase (NAD+) [Nematocida parisii]KAI5158452.1 glycerol-3-phosphate dehydrogenase (NAD+) [Nematocida parisii]